MDAQKNQMWKKVSQKKNWLVGKKMLLAGKCRPTGKKSGMKPLKKIKNLKSEFWPEVNFREKWNVTIGKGADCNRQKLEVQSQRFCASGQLWGKWEMDLWIVTSVKSL